MFLGIAHTERLEKLGKNRAKLRSLLYKVVLLMRRGLIIYATLVVLIPLAAFTALGEIFGGWFSLGYREESRQFQETLRLVSDHFVYAEKVNTGELTGNAIDNLLRSLDENSEYLSRKDAEEFEIDTEQRYGGIGVEVEWADERVTIVSPFADSPGELAGILPLSLIHI